MFRIIFSFMLVSGCFGFGAISSVNGLYQVSRRVNPDDLLNNFFQNYQPTKPVEAYSWSSGWS